MHENTSWEYYLDVLVPITIELGHLPERNYKICKNHLDRLYKLTYKNSKKIKKRISSKKEER